MPSDPATLDLIGSIYDAAVDAEHWPVVLQKLRQHLNCESTTLFVQDFRTQAGNANFSVEVDPAFERSYQQHYAARNVFLIRGKRLLKPGVVVESRTLCPDAEAFRSEFYNDWMEPQRLHQGLLAVLSCEESLTSMFGAMYRTGAPPISREQTAWLHVLIPHLQRAVRFHLHLSELKALEQAEREALNRWQLGVILLDGIGRVLFTNRKAEEILQRNDGLTLGPCGLRTSVSAETDKLNLLIKSARQVNAVSGGASGEMVLSRPSAKRDLNIFAVPASAAGGHFQVAGSVVALFISDPDAADETDENCFKRLYGLSRAEAKVAGLLAAGKDLRTISDELFVSRNTTRTHVKRVLEKTGTKRQAELVRLLYHVPIPPRNFHPFG
jgi:DNA-binding CsgD family transcriptional regulator